MMWSDWRRSPYGMFEPVPPIHYPYLKGGQREGKTWELLSRAFHQTVRKLIEKELNHTEEPMIYEVIVVEKVKDKPDVVLNPDGKALLLTAGSVTEAAFQAGAKLATCTFNANGKIEVLVRPFSA